jgi:uncharacterized protein YjiS (DUF1127 family)
MTTTRHDSLISAVFGSVATMVRTAGTRRAQRLALTSLLQMDASRLDDLGITTGDILTAIEARRR